MTASEKTIDVLPRHPLLASLQEHEQKRIVRSAERRQLDAGDTLFVHDSPATRFFIVTSGQLKLYRVSPSGQEKIVELLAPGRTFAEAVMFMPERRYPVTCEALTDAVVIGFSISDFLAILSESPDTTMRLLGVLSMKLRARLADIDSLSLQNATLRVANYLLQLVPSADREAAMVELPFSKRSIAARLSLQPETLSRVFARLGKWGLVSIDGPSVRVDSMARLQELCVRGRLD